MPFLRCLALFFVCLILTAPVQAIAQAPVSTQGAPANPTAILSGTVTDPTGALIPNAIVTLTTATQPPRTVSADDAARFTFRDLPPGTYSVSAAFPGFATTTLYSITLTDGQRTSIKLALNLETAQQELNVGSEGATLDPSHNGDSTVIKGDAIGLLSNDSSLLTQQLQGMSGGFGESSGQIFVDGFSGGKMPQSLPSARSASIRIPTPRSTTPSVTDASRSSPSPAQTIFTATSIPRGRIQHSTRKTHTQA